MIERVVSGGQTGVDRAALDVALDLGIPCGGWCPRGRRAEDGIIPARYPMRETDSADWAQRTRLNVAHSDGTLIVHGGSLDEGTRLTLEIAQTMERPVLAVRPEDGAAIDHVRSWLAEEEIRVLNIAGPRESKAPGIQAQATAFLGHLFAG